MSAERHWFGLRKAQAQVQSASASHPLLNPATWASTQDLIELQQRVGRIDLKQLHWASAHVAGIHLSRFRGRGMDYQESRPYQAGDDIRCMDWRVTARAGTPHTKLFQEERERPVLLFIDLHPGMFFGSRGMLKSVAAARAAALIAWATAAHGDRVGALLCNAGYHDLAPCGGRRGVLRLIRQLVEHTEPGVGINAPVQPGAMNAALSRLSQVARPGSLIVLLGDFYGVDGDSRRHLLRLRQHSDVVAIQIVDPLELAAPAPARYGVQAGGTSAILDTRSVGSKRAYEDYFSKHHQTVASTLRSCGIALLRLGTQDDVVTKLRQHFASDTLPARSQRTAA